jgi:spermidine synthase
LEEFLTVVEDEPTRKLEAAAARRIVLLIFLLSGAAGLVYEVVWARQLVLVFGNTTQAISAILTGFFGGMAIGSVIGGRIADRVRRPLRLYALLELLVVITVLVTPATFRGLHEVYRGVFESLETNPTALALIRFALAILALGPSTILMGATLPTLSRWLIRDHTQMGEGFGSLYTANTVGAIIGTVASGLILIELVGLSTTLAIGAACSATAAIAAFLLSLRLERGEAPAFGLESHPAAIPVLDPPGAAVAKPAPARKVVAAIKEVADPNARPKLALLLAFVSGLTSLGYQNLWTRVLSSGTGSNSYIFTSILAIFLTGIAIGAFIFARFLSKTKRPIVLLGLAELTLALIVLVGLGAATKYPFRFGFPYELLIVVVPSTLIMGVVFPMSSMLVADSDSHVGKSAGMLLGANTLGAICGTFVVPFVLMPMLTSPKAIVLIAAVNAATGLVLLLQDRGLPVRFRRAGSLVSAAVGIAAVVLLLVPNRLVADPEINNLHRVRATLFASQEDDIASVQAGRLAGGELRLYVGGYSMTGMSADTRMMGHLPVMLRPNAKSMCVIAFGMGSAFHSALMQGLKVDAVELVPSVPDMFGYFYKDAAEARSNPNGRILVADGRNHVDLTTSMYDLMVVDPPPPMGSSGAAVLYSQEFYQASKARLNPGGVMMEWEFLGQTVDEFRSHVKTFASVFKHVTILFGAASGTPGVYMFGSDEPIPFDAANMQAVLSKNGVLNDLSTAEDSPQGVTTAQQWQQRLLDDIWISDAQVVQFGAPGTLITDDHPFTEYDMLRHMVGTASPRATRYTLLQAMPKSPSN